MGLKRESLALSEEEKEIVAYHEGGHAVCAYVLEHADPLHKVTILPTGMALGVTQQLPVEERHIYKREYIADSLVVRLGGRVAEELVFGHQSTGAQNDLVGNTELARKMVREWGMSDRIGPMAWGSQGAVFLGDDLMHTRDYSDETARVIDEEVERILRDEEDRCRKVLTEYRAGLDAVAQALLERETLDGDEVEDLVDQAMGRKVGGPRRSCTPTAPRRSRPKRIAGSRRPTTCSPTSRRSTGSNASETTAEPYRKGALVTRQGRARGRRSATWSRPRQIEGGSAGMDVLGAYVRDRGPQSAAVNAPMNDARVTPSASAITMMGAASIVYRSCSSGRAKYSISSTATSGDSSGAAFSARPAHDSQRVEVNSTTSHGASGRAKSRRSS